MGNSFAFITPVLRVNCLVSVNFCRSLPFDLGVLRPTVMKKELRKSSINAYGD